MRETIVFKGINGQIELQFDPAAEFAKVMTALRNKLKSAGDFFDQGSVVRLPARLRFSGEEIGEMTALLAEFGLVSEIAPEPVEAPAAQERDQYEIKALVVGRTLRSGQRVTHDGSVVVIGDVNAGAQVIAGEDIIILGACRGVAHAGASGNRSATITAGKILAPQLRIAGVIARSPDGDGDKPAASIEIARIRDGMVIIEPANK